MIPPPTESLEVFLCSYVKNVLSYKFWAAITQFVSDIAPHDICRSYLFINRIFVQSFDNDNSVSTHSIDGKI